MIPGAENRCIAKLQSLWAAAQENAQPQSDRRLSFAAPKEGRRHKRTDRDHVYSIVMSNQKELHNLTYWALTQLSG